MRFNQEKAIQIQNLNIENLNVTIQNEEDLFEEIYEEITGKPCEEEQCSPENLDNALVNKLLSLLEEKAEEDCAITKCTIDNFFDQILGGFKKEKAERAPKGCGIQVTLEKIEPDTLEKIEPDTLEKVEPDTLEKIEPDTLEKVEADRLERIEDTLERVEEEDTIERIENETQTNIVSETLERIDERADEGTVLERVVCGEAEVLSSENEDPGTEEADSFERVQPEDETLERVCTEDALERVDDLVSRSGPVRFGEFVREEDSLERVEEDTLEHVTIVPPNPNDTLERI